MEQSWRYSVNFCLCFFFVVRSTTSAPTTPATTSARWRAWTRSAATSIAVTSCWTPRWKLTSSPGASRRRGRRSGKRKRRRCWAKPCKMTRWCREPSPHPSQRRAPKGCSRCSRSHSPRKKIRVVSLPTAGQARERSLTLGLLLLVLPPLPRPCYHGCW